MSYFFPDAVEDRARLAATRTMKNIEDSWAWAQKHPIESAFAIAVVAVAFITFPLPTILVLAIGALALFGLNAATESSVFEQLRSI
jgi:hypothetical protein